MINNLPSGLELPLDTIPSGPNLPPPRRRLRRPGLMTIAMLAILALWFTCLAGLLVAARQLRNPNLQAYQPIETVLDDFMQNMAWHNPHNAYGAFSPRAQQAMPYEHIERLMDSSLFVLFKDYASVTVDRVKIRRVRSANPHAAQGQVATIHARLSYERGLTGEMDAILEYVDDHWMLYSYSIRPPEALYRRKMQRS